MDRVGGFTLTAPLGISEPGVRWYSGQRSGGGPGESVWVACCAPDPLVTGAAAADRIVRSFLSSACAQRDLARRIDGRVAEIVELGVDGRVAYRAVRPEPLRASDLIAGRVRFSAVSLRSLMQGVLEAVASLETVGRRHGRLTPDRVLLDPSGGGSGRWRVVLDGPAGALELAEAEPDLRQAGRLLYELIVREPYRPTVGYPLEESGPYQRLGRASAGFLALTNRLLDPSMQLGSGGDSASSILEELAAIDVREKSGGRAGLIAAAAAALVLAGGGVAAWQVLGGSAEPAPREVSFLDESELELWVEHVVWLTRARRSLDDPALRAAVSSDEVLASGFVEPLMAVEVAELSPLRVVAGDLRSEVESEADLLEWVRDNAEEFLAQETPLGPVVSARASLVRGALEAVESAPSVARASALGSVWSAERRWGAAGERAGALVRPLDAEVLPDDVAETLGALTDELRLMESLEARYVSLVETADRIAAAGAASDGDPADPVLSAYGTFVRNAAEDAGARAAPGPDAVTATAEALTPVEERTAAMESFVLETRGGWSSVDRELFSERSESVRDFVEGSVTLSVGFYGRWQDEAAQERFRSLDPEDDPRNEWGAGGVLSRLSADLSELRADYPDDAPAAIAGATEAGVSLDDRIAALRQRVGALDAPGLGWKRRNEERIRTGVASVDRDVAALERVVNDVVADVRVSWEELVPALRARAGVSLIGLSSVNTVYAGRRDELIEFHGVRADAEAAKALRDDERALSTFLRGVESSLEIDPAWAAAPSGFDSARMNAAVRARVDEAAGDALAAAGTSWDGERYAEGAAGDAVRSARSSLEAWADEAVAAASAYAAAERLLEGAYLPDEAWPQGGQTLAGIVRARRPFLDSEPGVAAGLGDVPARAGRVVDAWEAASVPELVRLAGDVTSPPALARAAYARLDEASGGTWPGSAEDVSADLGAAARVLSAAEALSDAGRSSSVLSSVAEVRRARVVRGLSGLEDADAMGEALGAVSAAGVEAASLPAWARFNLSAWSLGREAAGVEDDAAVRALAGRFVDELSSIGAEFSGGLGGGPIGADAAGAWVDELRGIANPEADQGPRFDPASEGPAKEGWTVESNEDLTRLTYTSPDGSVRLGFASVELGADGPEPRLVFMGTEEVSIAAFNAIVGDERSRWNALRSRWADFDDLYGLRPGDPTERWEGVRSWRWDAQAERLAANTTWVSPNELMEESPAYPAGLVDPADPTAVSSDQGRPSALHPVNYVSCDAARRVAFWAGCRLPTVEEWAAAFGALEGEPDPAAWNLRDGSVEALRAHLIDRQAGGVVRQFVEAANRAFEPPRLDVDLEDWSAWPVEDDGRLWFDEVGERGTVLRGMLGNVAEICDNGEFSIIGGSALSHATGDPSDLLTPSPLRRPRDSEFGFADVGFRVAFEAEGALQRPPAVELARLLDRVAYVRGR